MEFLLSYRKKNLRKRTVEFIEALHHTMGVHSVVLQGYRVGDNMTTVVYVVNVQFSFTLIHISLSIETETSVNCNQDRAFTRSSNDHKAWAMQGGVLLRDFMAEEGEY